MGNKSPLKGNAPKPSHSAPGPTPPFRRRRYRLTSLICALGIVMTMSVILFDFIPFTPPATPAQIAAAQKDLAALETAISAFNTDTTRYPTTNEGLAALLNAPSTVTNWRGPYIQTPPSDPWGHPYIYRGFLRNGAWRFQILSAGPDAKPDTPDDIAMP